MRVETIESSRLSRSKRFVAVSWCVDVGKLFEADDGVMIVQKRESAVMYIRVNRRRIHQQERTERLVLFFFVVSDGLALRGRGVEIVGKGNRSGWKEGASHSLTEARDRTSILTDVAGVAEIDPGDDGIVVAYYPTRHRVYTHPSLRVDRFGGTWSSRRFGGNIPMLWRKYLGREGIGTVELRVDR